MSFNPLTEKGIPIEEQFRNWRELNVEPFDKREVHPYTRCRVIVMNGAEMEAMWFSHQFARHCPDLDVKRKLALTRRIETQQQKAVNWLIPGDETPLETTIGYEQVAVDLTAWLARNEPDPYLKQALEFGLLEDFDHLYRYADLYELTKGERAEELTQGLTEIMPGRPTKVEHRHPVDDVRLSYDKNTAAPISVLNVQTIVAAEQQTLNFYVNHGPEVMEPVARGLYAEIAQIEEQHVTHYESLIDASTTWWESLVWHEYGECHLYHSFLNDEVDPKVKKIWELHLAMEIEHLKIACELMRQHQGRDPEEMLPKELPAPTKFEPNKGYVRELLATQVQLTADETAFVPVSELPPEHRYFEQQRKVNGDWVPSEAVITEHREKQGREYRHQTEGEHPVIDLRESYSARQ